MSRLNIYTSGSMGVTIIPNYFLDRYMPEANGEFVKIYLCLLRAAGSVTDFSLSTVADCMVCTEKDVIRALKYWAREGLLKVTYGSDKKPQDITFLEPEDKTAATIERSVQHEEDSPLLSPPKRPHSPKSGLTADKVKQLKENQEIAELLFIAQQYLGKTLSPVETSRILYFYEGLGFHPDLIEYLIEYCVCKGHKSMNYIEKVAFAWKEEGILTSEDAKAASSCYHRDYYAVFKALGIRSRDPVEAEIKIMDVWLKDYGFSMELITEACTRTVLATKQPSLQYTDGILQKWKAAGVKTPGDVQKLDDAHEQSKSNKPDQKPARTGGTKFSNFDQRSYDYDSLESKLLNQ